MRKPASLKFVFALAALTILPATIALANKGASPARYCRFQAGERIAYGVVEGERVRELSGDLFGSPQRTDRTYALQEVKLLVPVQPTQVVALAGNYRSHLGQDHVTTTITTTTTVVTDRETGETSAQSQTTSETRSADQVPARFQIVQPFFKTPACLVAHEGEIVLPADAGPVHYEAELVIVIGKTARNVSKDRALEFVFGVTCGNDVSARAWQKNDVQWWRAKGSDTFGPCGPFIATGLDYDDLLMQLRLNGDVRQKERTSEMIHDVATTVSVISQQVTLNPGDLIFTGTPGETAEMNPGDVVEVELEGVGVLRNRVVAGK
ncbi:MAG TPA: fumarylacetoacetate hydrolase family protein [Planctomycetaceae bacterium]|nr:fumarylacetoacetate hydrolase family protein [Planctomycetaceae bacterium]